MRRMGQPRYFQAWISVIIYKEFVRLEGDRMISNLNVMMTISAVELIAVETMFCFHIQRRMCFAGKALLCGLLLFAYTLLFPLACLGLFVQIPIVILSFLYVYLCYEISIPQTLFIGTAGYTIGQIASVIGSLIMLADPELFAHFGIDIKINIYADALIIACYAAIDIAAYFLIMRKMRGTGLLKNATIPIVLLSTVMLAVNQMLGLSFSIYGAGQAGVFLSFLEYIWNLICCVFCLCIQFGIFRISQKEQELEVTKRLMAQKEQQYQMSKATAEAINRKCHNLKYELSAMSAGPDNRRHVDEAMALVDSFDAAVRTGNETLDVILSEKNHYCQQEQITFVCMVDGEKLDFMDATDQYVLFGNLIDNAINAVQKLDEPQQRVIYITICAKKKLLLIHTENPFTGVLRFRDGLPRTSSGDEENHGFGMASVRLICEKYGGSVSTKAESGTFHLNIMIPLP